MDRGQKRGAEGEQERRSVKPRLHEELERSRRKLEEEVRSHARRQEEVVEELEGKLEELEQELEEKEQKGEEQEQRIAANAEAIQELTENQQNEMQELRTELSKGQKKVEAMETFEESVVQTIVNPEMSAALEMMKKQQETIGELERKLNALEAKPKNNILAKKSIPMKPIEMPAKENVQSMKMRLRGINITIAKAEAPKEMQNNVTKIPNELKVESFINTNSINLSCDSTFVKSPTADTKKNVSNLKTGEHLIVNSVEDETIRVSIKPTANVTKEVEIKGEASDLKTEIEKSVENKTTPWAIEPETNVTNEVESAENVPTLETDDEHLIEESVEHETITKEVENKEDVPNLKSNNHLIEESVLETLLRLAMIEKSLRVETANITKYDDSKDASSIITDGHLIEELVEDEAVTLTELDTNNEEQSDKNETEVASSNEEATGLKEIEEEVFDPFWFCGPPSEVLLRMNNCSTAQEFLKMKENQAKEQYRKMLADENEGNKRKREEEEEERKTRQRLEVEEEMTRKRKRDDVEEDDCGQCYRGWVHECFEDVLVC